MVLIAQRVMDKPTSFLSEELVKIYRLGIWAG